MATNHGSRRLFPPVLPAEGFSRVLELPYFTCYCTSVNLLLLVECYLEIPIGLL